MNARGPAKVLWMRPKKWREFQHYHDERSLKWIKNFIEIDLPGSKFSQLSWADQGRLQALWRLAARLGRDGRIPYDEKYLRNALGDKRFPFASHLLPTWFHIGTETELKRAAKREERSRVSPQKPSLEVYKEEREREEADASSLLNTLVVVEEQPPKLTKLEGRDTAFDTLVQLCGIDQRSQRVTDVAVALRGARGKPGIRRMFWEEQGGVKGDAFERLLSAEIRHRADIYRRKLPGAALTPTALQKWWFDVLTHPEPTSGVATVEERLWRHADQIEERRSLEAG